MCTIYHGTTSLCSRGNRLPTTMYVAIWKAALPPLTQAKHCMPAGDCMLSGAIGGEK